MASIEIPDEVADEIVVADLKECIRTHSNMEFDKFETVDNKVALLAAFYMVLEYYMKPSDYQEFLKEVGNDLR